MFHSNFDHKNVPVLLDEERRYVMNIKYTSVVAETEYTVLSIDTQLSRYHKVYVVDIVQAKVDMVSQRRSLIQDVYI